MARPKQAIKRSVLHLVNIVQIRSPCIYYAMHVCFNWVLRSPICFVFCFLGGVSLFLSKLLHQTSVLFTEFLPIICTSLLQISESEYEVKGHETTDQQQLVYQVNTDLGMCSCPVGKTGGPCKHQGAVLKLFGKNLKNFLPVMSSEPRTLFYKIATGRLVILFTNISVHPAKHSKGEQTTEKKNVLSNSVTGIMAFVTIEWLINYYIM